MGEGLVPHLGLGHLEALQVLRGPVLVREADPLARRRRHYDVYYSKGTVIVAVLGGVAP